MKMEVKKQEYKKEQGKGLGEAEKNSRSSLSSRLLRLYALTLALFLLSIFIIYLLLATGGSFFQTGIKLLLLGLLCLCILTLAYFYYDVLRPYKTYQSTLRRVLEGYSEVQELQELPVYLTEESHEEYHYISEILSANKIIEEGEKLAYIQNLQNQMNPHFLYNILENIRSESLLNGLESVANMAELLGDFYRYTISQEENFVSLKEELDNTEVYFQIQRFRFSKKLELEVKVQEDLLSLKVPRILLQPIVENSIVHGLEGRETGGKVGISISRSNQHVYIQVSDDGIGIEEEKLRQINEDLRNIRRGFQGGVVGKGGMGKAGMGVSLLNIQERIHLLYGREYGLYLQSLENAGTDVCVVLPRELSVKQEEESFISESLDLLSEEENALIIKKEISSKEPEKEELLFALELYLSEGNHFTVENLSFQLFSGESLLFLALDKPIPKDLVFALNDEKELYYGCVKSYENKMKTVPKVWMTGDGSSLIEGQTVLSNLFVYQPEYPHFLLRNKELIVRYKELFPELFREIPYQKSVEALEKKHRILVEIMKGIIAGARVFALWEVHLMKEDEKELYAYIEKWKKQGYAFLFFSSEPSDAQKPCERLGVWKEKRILKVIDKNE
ncbi:sensor histidine kinase [Oribacterium parvum]